MSAAPSTVSEGSTWSIESRIDFLLRLRREIGPRFGSEDLCILLYSLVKRERPAVVVELGTGYGVTATWIAAAMRENGSGRLLTFDNGSAFMQPRTQEFLSKLTGSLAELATAAQISSFAQYLEIMFRRADVDAHVTFAQREFDVRNLSWLEQMLAGSRIDMLFSDFDHAPQTIATLLGQCLPLMHHTSSVFIDSASTHLPAFLTLERLVEQLNRRQLPKCIADQLSDSQRMSVKELMAGSTFKLMHLLENVRRKQNSTAWLRIEPVDLVPPPVTDFLH